jgi:delta1-piperideine-2-carboxylate reductase
VAAILARNCATCERDGSYSHGVFRIPGYRASIRSGWVDPDAEPVIARAGASLLRVDAANGFAQPALARAESRIRAIVAETGVAVAAFRNSHHFSALWPDLEPFAEAGLVALTMVTGGPAVTPPGATGRLFGTNPIAFATPVAGARPLVMDFATSSMSQGDLRLARDAGRRVPPGTGLGRGGRDTDDPEEILSEGGILPFGGHKGTALSLMVEIFASALTGGSFSHEVDWSAHPGAETPCTGQLLIVIDPTRGDNEAFTARVAALVSLLRRSGLDRLPADRRYRHRDAAAVKGIPVTDAIHALFT